ncbi:MAG: hypothetical protein AAGB29_05605 [Planctomycetota bacterium]
MQANYGAILSLVIALGLIVGSLLIAVGWRGRRVSDHPHCRPCKFDLHGSMDTNGLAPESCPECGCSLRSGRRVQQGLRRKRPALLSVGLAVLLLGVGAIGVQAYVGSRNVSLNPYKPVWLLRYEAGRHGTATSVAALDELIARHHAGRLAQPAIDLLVAEGMQLQADMTATWEPRWGELVEYAREQGQVNDADWERYMATAVTVSLALEVRPRVRIGEPIYTWTVSRRSRLSDSDRRWWARMTTQSFEVDGIVDPKSLRDRGSSGTSIRGRSGRGRTGTYEDFNRDVWGELEPGTHEAARTVAIELFEMDANNGRKIEPAFLTVEHRLTDTFELTDESTVAAVVNDEHRQAVRDALKIESIEFETNGWPGFDFQIELDHPPVGLAFDVFIVADDGTEAKIGSLDEGANDSTHLSTGHNQRELTWNDPVVRVVFRPSAERAMRTADVFEYWGEEVVFEDVPVKLPEPSPAEEASP